MTRDRMRALRFSNEMVDDVTQLVYLHLRFHTYQMGWTDAAVRRFVRDAGDQLEELLALTRADCTTRNRRKAEALERRIDDLELRIAELRRAEELDAIRPDLDGTDVMEHLGLPPGRLVGEALSFLLEPAHGAGTDGSGRGPGRARPVVGGPGGVTPSRPGATGRMRRATIR